MLKYDAERYNMRYYDMMRYDTIRYDTIRYITVFYLPEDQPFQVDQKHQDHQLNPAKYKKGSVWIKLIIYTRKGTAVGKTILGWGDKNDREPNIFYFCPT